MRIISIHLSQNFSKKNRRANDLIISSAEQLLIYLENYYESPIEILCGNALVVGLAMHSYPTLPGGILRQIKQGDFGENDGLIVFKDLMENLPTIFIEPQDNTVSKRRIDIAIYFSIPGKKIHKLAIECDGYKYHKDAKKFTDDRKKDREIKKSGFEDVFRFSGSELWNDPISVSKEIIDWITSKDSRFYE